MKNLLLILLLTVFCFSCLQRKRVVMSDNSEEDVLCLFSDTIANIFPPNEIEGIAYRNVDVNIINVIDSAFYRVLDEIIKYESRYSYYSDTLPYGITIVKLSTVQGDSVIVLGIAGHSEKGIFIENGHLLGSLFYKGHDFFITGSNILESIAITDKKKVFKFNAKFVSDDDDRWTIYNYIYYENDFIFYDNN